MRSPFTPNPSLLAKLDAERAASIVALTGSLASDPGAASGAGYADPIFQTVVPPQVGAPQDVPPSAPRARASRARTWVAVLLALACGVALGYLGWVLPTPGRSLLVPTAIVFGIGVAISLLAWVAGSLGVSRRSLMTFSAAAAVCTVLACVWTFQFSLPAHLEWNSGATNQAQQTLVHLSRLPRGPDGARSEPCTMVSTGSIGPLSAPYKECAEYTFAGHFVTYDSVQSPEHGLGYTDVGAATFQDECSRHLVGEWWMYSPEENGVGACPFGYHFHGAA